MNRDTNQFKVKRRKKYQVAGVHVPVLPYYYLWYGSGMMAPYGGPGGSNETAQNDFGKDSDGAGPDSGGSAAAGDASGSGTV